MAIKGESRKYESKYGFRVKIDGVEVAHFNKCSELSAEIEKILIREGGGTVGELQLGLVNVNDITLERGAVSTDTDLYDWFKKAVNLVANKGIPDADVKESKDIIGLGRDDLPVIRWRCFGCLPLMFVAGEWDNDASEVNVTKIKIGVTSFERVSV